MFRKIKNIFEDPKILIFYILKFTSALWSDSQYLKILYWYKTGKKLNLKDPCTFNEKLQWLKAYNHRSEYTDMVDKVKVKEYVKNIIGEKYVIPTLAVWEKAEDIDFDKLPDKFVIKTNHSGGNTGVCICKDKTNFDADAARNKMAISLKKSNIYKVYREWPYKNVEKRILAEVLLAYETNPDNEIHDYKFYCFDGRVEYILVSNERALGHVKFDYFDRDFNHLDLRQGGDNYNGKIDSPKNLNLMISLAEKLSKGIPHVRVDFYDVNDKVYFGEMTFFDSSGFAEFEPEEWNLLWGNKIKLPSKLK